MQRFTSAIRASVREENWFSALFLALAMPDICSTLESPPTGKRDGGTGRRYRGWFERYLNQMYNPSDYYESLESRGHVQVAPMSSETIELRKKLGFDKSTILPKSCAFTAQDCYTFRCKCLHQGLPERHDGENFIFVAPRIQGDVLTSSRLNGILYLQIDVFCEDICIAVERWCEDVKTHAEIQQRISELINIHPWP